MEPAREQGKESIFNLVWNDLTEKVGESKMRFPKELLWLNGAPGSGKGTIADFVKKQRHITHIATSDLLNKPEHLEMKGSTGLVTDIDVLQALLEELLKEKHKWGVVIDGFPRSKTQAEFLQLLHDKMMDLHKKYFHSDQAALFNRPKFHIVMLYIEEEESIQRQLARGRRIVEHNENVKRTGEGKLMEGRATDFVVDAARGRYRTFREEGYEPLKKLRDAFQYHFIDAEGPLETVRRQVYKEFLYQSSMELADEAHKLVSTIPLADKIGEHYRQNIVRTIDECAMHHQELFKEVVKVIQRDFLPIINFCVSSGEAVVRSQDPVFFGNKIAIPLALAVLSERGFHVSTRKLKVEVPNSVNFTTGEISTYTRVSWEFLIRFTRGKRNPSSEERY